MNAPGLMQVTINVIDLDAAIVAWRSGIGFEAAVDVSARRARIDVRGIAIVLVETPSDAQGGLSGIALGVEQIERLRSDLVDIIIASGDVLSLDPGATSGAAITIVEVPRV